MRIASLLALLLGVVLPMRAEEPADELAMEPDTTYTVVTVSRGDEVESITAYEHVDTAGQQNRGWVKQLIATGFHINDPSIRYPRFAKWLVGVYNWGDRTFNSYDPEYVVGTGKNWKLMAQNDMWMRTYVMHFSDNSLMHITSHLYDDMGVKLCFMAVSLGYTFNVNDWMGEKTNRHRFNLDFTCSLFSASFTQQSVKGNSTIRKFGDYDHGGHLSYKFNDIEVDNTSFDIYYFFNHNKYSRAAAYCFSKYQLQSAGSWVIGFNYLKQHIDMDFKRLPPGMLAAIPGIVSGYRFSHTDYNLLWGYAHNWVLKPRVWLINLSVFPSLGYKHSSESSKSIRDMLSTNLEGQAAIVYNHKMLFATLAGRFNGYLNFGKSYTFFNSSQIMTACVGIRF